MTDQFLPTNINAPRQSTAVTGSLALTFDEQLIFADSSGGPFTLTLPDARQIPSWTIVVKAPSAGTDNVTVDTILGQTIDGVATFVFTTNQESRFFISNGTNWVTAGEGGGGIAGVSVEDEGIVVQPNTTIFNFVGAGVTAVPVGLNQVDVTIPGAGIGIFRQEILAAQNITGTDTVLAATLSFVPLSNESVTLTLNGLRQAQGAGNDYTIAGTSITWLASTGTAVDMVTSDIIVVQYVS